MYKLPKETRDNIINYISNAVVPAHVGANLFQISQALGALEEIKEETKKEE